MTAEERRVAERREGYCDRHGDHANDISIQKGMWSILILFIVAMLGFAGYVGTAAQRLDKNVATFIARTDHRMEIYDGVFMDTKAMLTLQGEMIRDIDGRVRHLEYRIDSRNRPHPQINPSGGD